MSLDDFSRLAEHERQDRRKSTITMAFLGLAVVLAVIAVIAVLAWRGW